MNLIINQICKFGSDPCPSLGMDKKGDFICLKYLKAYRLIDFDRGKNIKDNTSYCEGKSTQELNKGIDFPYGR